MSKPRTAEQRERARINARDFLAAKLVRDGGMNSEKAHREATKVAQESAKKDSAKEG